jgi:hypothetical protein
MVNNRECIIHKSAKKKGKRHDYDIYKDNYPATPKQVVNVFDLGYLGVEKDFPEQQYHPYLIGRRETCYSYSMTIKNTTKVTLKKG